MLNARKIRERFPVGFYDDLHKDFSINFQMNRFYSWANDEDMLKEMREASRHINNYDEHIAKFLELSEKALKDGHKLRGAFYLRGAEFFIPKSNPKKQTYRKEFISLMLEHFHVKENEHFKVPYENSYLSAYQFTPENPKGTIVFFAGYDGYIEELFSLLIGMKEEGYDVVCFDGPGQGSVLEDCKMPMTHEWEKPVKAILDFFNLNDVTLIGMSLGGYLVLRAAAFEKRVKRVIADDIFPDMYRMIIAALPVNLREIVNTLMENESAEELNSLIKKLMNESLIIKWAFTQGLNVTGSQTPYEYLNKIMLYNTREISGQVEQDVLLMVAKEDHYVPLEQFSEQIETLTNVRSLTTRTFTRKEHAQNHCHVGNIGLSAEVMLDWIEQISQ